ncbi:MAG: PorV/PorQ family protein [candidate division KSB1 bacterium]|nr:PorV/PorQ family protein [candidate division KSB1 bacterium]
MLVLMVALGLVATHSALGQKVGSTSMQFLKVVPSARGAALGEAYSVWATGAEAIFWNPAGLSKLEGMEFTTTYVDWLFDAQQGALAIAKSFQGMGTIGLQLQYADFGEFEETSTARPYINDPEHPGFTGRTFRPFGCVLGATYARDLTDKFSVGIGMKYAYQSLFSEREVTAMVRQGVYEQVKTWAGGLLFDFGIRYNTGYRTIHIGSSVQNFGANVKFAKEAHPVPLLFRFGVGADLLGPHALLVPGEGEHRLGMVFDIFHPNDYDQQMHLGAEYEFRGLLALRAGYKFNYDFDGLTLGAGIKYAVDGLRVRLDWSYGDMGTYLGNVQRISVGLTLP